jgi:hypothetical protein
LLEVVDALRAASGLSRGLNRRQQEGDQDADDRDHDQQLDKRKARTAAMPTTIMKNHLRILSLLKMPSGIAAESAREF